MGRSWAHSSLSLFIGAGSPNKRRATCYDMEALKLDYTVGGGANRVERGELVIYNWDRQIEPAGLF